MDASILQKIQSVLNTLILEEALLIKSAEDASIDVSFSAPDTKFKDTLGNNPVINCYLVNVEENTTMNKSGSPTLTPKLQKDQSFHVIQIAPKFIDMHYVISFWSKDIKGASEIEHLLMGYIISGLGKFERIPVNILKKHDIEVGSSQVEFTLFGNATGKGLSDHIWQSMGSIHKPSIALTVTVPVSIDKDRNAPVITEISRIFGNVERIN